MAVALTKAIQFTFLSRREVFTAMVPDHIVDVPEFQSSVTVNGMGQSIHAAPAGMVSPEANGQSFQATRTARGGATVGVFAQQGTVEPDALAGRVDLPIAPLPQLHDNPKVVDDIAAYPSQEVADALTPEETFVYWPATGRMVVWAHVPWVFGGGPDLDALLAGLLVMRDNNLMPIIDIASPLGAGDQTDDAQRDSTTYYSALPVGTPPTNVSGDPSVGTPLSVTFTYVGALGVDHDDIDEDSVVVTRTSGSLTVSCDGPLAELSNLQQIAAGIASAVTPGAGR